MLHKVSAVLEGSRPGSGGGHTTGNGTPDADADAVAAAERAMQALLVCSVCTCPLCLLHGSSKRYAGLTANATENIYCICLGGSMVL